MVFEIWVWLILKESDFWFLGEMNDTERTSLAITKQKAHRPGGCDGIFFQLFDWNRRFSKKKLFSMKLLPAIYFIYLKTKIPIWPRMLKIVCSSCLMPVLLLLLLFNPCKTTIKEVWRGWEEAQNKAPHVPLDLKRKRKKKERENNGFNYFFWLCWRLKRRKEEKEKEEIMDSIIYCWFAEDWELKKKRKKKLNMVASFF